MPDPKKPNWFFWTTAALLLPVLYVASFGPAIWIWSYAEDEGIINPEGPVNWTLCMVYSPLFWLITDGPTPIANALEQYRSLVQLGVHNGSGTHY